MSEATAAGFMSRDVKTVLDTMDVREAIATFEEHDISGAPVVDADGNLVGVISQTDVLHYYLSRDDELTLDTDYYQRAHLGGIPWKKGFEILDTNVPPIRDIMSPVTITAAPTTPVSELAATMVERRIHRVIITDGDAVVGLVSALDLLRALAG